MKYISAKAWLIENYFLELRCNLSYMTNDTDHYGSDRCVSMTDEGLTLKTVVLLGGM